MECKFDNKSFFLRSPKVLFQDNGFSIHNLELDELDRIRNTIKKPIALCSKTSSHFTVHIRTPNGVCFSKEIPLDEFDAVKSLYKIKISQKQQEELIEHHN